MELASGLTLIFAVVTLWNREWSRGAFLGVVALLLWWLAVWLTKRSGHAPPSS